MVAQLSPNSDTFESPSGKITLDVVPFIPSLLSQGAICNTPIQPAILRTVSFPLPLIFHPSHFPLPHLDIPSFTISTTLFANNHASGGNLPVT